MHDGLVFERNVQKAAKIVLDLGVGSIAHLAGKEPVLAEFIDESATQIAGKMVLAGCDDAVVRGVYNDTLSTIVIALEALRDGHYQLWQCENSSSIDIPPSEREGE